jgi:putative sigma-54 modulation protein
MQLFFKEMLMLFTITGKHFEITDRIRAHAEEKTEKLPKYYDNINQIEVIIEGNGADHGVEIIARAEHSNVFIAKEMGDNTFTCIDMAVHKLESQLRKKKEKQRNNKHIAGASETETDLTEAS